MNAKQILKKNRIIYKATVSIIESLISLKNKILWNFWKRNANVALTIGNVIHTKYVPVLYMHWFVTEAEKNSVEKFSSSRWYASVESFKIQLQWMKEKNYHFLSVDEYYQWYRNELKIPRKSVLLTFDDGERSLYDLVIPILEELKIPAVFFVIGKRLQNDTPELPDGAQESEIDFMGKSDFESINKYSKLITFGSHTYNMHFSVNGIKAVNYVTPEIINKDFEKMTQFHFDYFAAPYGEYNDCVYENVKKHHKMGFTVETPGCPYSIQGEDIYRIRRIRVDGLTELGDLKKVL